MTEHSPKIFAMANQKGGVGKTTTSINVAAALADYGLKVLLVDLDPQGNGTMGCGIDKRTLKKSVNDVLLDECTVPQAVCASSVPNLSVLPANSDLTEAEVRLLQLEEKEFRLRRALEAADSFYDYIIIDCPPSLNMLTVNGLVAANGVIIPLQCEYFALEGLSALMETISQLQAGANPALKIEGIIRTMYDPRNRLTQEVSEQLLEHFGSKVYKIVIPRNVRLAEAPSYGLPIMHYEKRSPGAVAYSALAGEIIRAQAGETEAAEVVAEETV